MSHKSSVPLHWRLFKNKYMFIGSRCVKCNKKTLNSIKACNSCGSKTEEFLFSGKGVIVSYTTIYTAPEGFDRVVPYNVAIIKLDEDVTISSQLIDKIEKNCVGKQVRMVFRKTYSDGNSGINHYGFKFEFC